MDHTNPATLLVEFQPLGRRVRVPRDTSLLEAAHDGGLALLSVCGGAGLCDSCRVRLVRGEVSPPTGAERARLADDALEAGVRLACQARALTDVVVEVPVESLGTEQRLQIDSACGQVAPEPAVRAVDVALAPPSLADARSDLTRLREAWQAHDPEGGTVPHAVLTTLSGALRHTGWRARLVVGDRTLVAVLPPETALLGLAVDVGTTKIATYLVDLATGRTIAAMGAPNPQIAHGEDVISRIAYAGRTPGGAQTLHAELMDGLNAMVEQACAGAGVSRDRLVDAVVVGNTAMHHLVAGLSVEGLGRAPYVAAVGEALTLPARDIGLDIAPGARVYLPPNIAGYVGADHVAALTALDVPADRRTRLAIDIGTNTEVSLFAGGRILSCSCASGPAFEGAHIGCGMRAGSGAIERVRVVDGVVRVGTIGDVAPIGLCGSGILDAVAELASHGAVDRQGAFRASHSLVTQRDGAPVFVVAEASATGHHHDLVLTRRDISEIQLAKAAIRAGIETLLEVAGAGADAIDEVLVAGAFGTYLDLGSAIRVGMLPALPAGRFRQVGNAAGAGARQMLLARGRRARGEQLAAQVEYVELSSRPRFADAFAAALGF
jgi:uncharacterized 2Fe-2S/4Fe-4S cluster protein (DUF4445 family)